MTSTTENKPNEGDELICPLFPYYGDEGEKKVLARKVARISLATVKPGATNGRPRRVTIPKRHFQRIDPETEDTIEFVMDPYSTTEEEIEDWFGGGEYYLQAFDANNVYLAARALTFSSPKKDHERMGRRAGVFRDDEDDDDEDEAPRRPLVERENPMTSVLKDMLAQQQKSATDQMGMVQKMADNTIQHALGSRNNDNAQVEALRRQQEEMSRDHREEMRRRDKENEDDRTRFRADLDRRDREMDSLRKRSEDEVRELRTRYDRDLDDLKKRFERDLTHEVDRYESKYKSLEKEYNEYKDRTRKDLHELEKENLELSKDLASVPEEKEDKSIPKIPDMPWWAAAGLEILRNPPKLPVLQQPGTPQQQPLTQQQIIQTPPPAPPPAVVAQQMQAQQQQQAAQQAYAQQIAQQQAAQQAYAQQVAAQQAQAAQVQQPPVQVSTPVQASASDPSSPFSLRASVTFDSIEDDEDESDEDGDESTEESAQA